MILAETMAAVAVYYAGALENGGRPVGDVIRYPRITDDDCCSPNESGESAGSLRIRYERMGTTENPPSIVPVWGPCRAKSAVELHLRLLRCWDSSLEQGSEAMDRAAAELLDDAWILGCATNALMNDTNLLGLCDESGKRVGCSIGGWTVVPVFPQGGCAGNELVMFVSLAGPCSILAEDSGS